MADKFGIAADDQPQAGPKFGVSADAPENKGAAPAPTLKDYAGRAMATIGNMAQAPGNMMEGIKGAVKSGIRTAYNPLSALSEPIHGAVDALTEPSNTAQRVGSYVPDVALTLMPGGAAEEAGRLIPNAERAGKVLERAKVLGKDVPVDLTKAMTPALRAQELATRGSAPPKVMNDFLQRIPVHTSEPMMFPEARDFASNAGALSATEKAASTPMMAGQVKQLAKALSEANQAAAEQMGMGKEFKGAMREYAQAKALGKGKDAAIEIAKKWVPRAIVGGAAAGAGYKIAKGLGE